MRARHRLSRLLLRPGIVYYDGRAWTGRHDTWLRQLRLPTAATQMAFDNDYDAVLSVQARRDRLDAAIAAMAADSQFTPLVARLGCLRGISTLTGFALAVEIGDWHRFTGNTIGAFVGLILASTPPAPRGCKARLPRPATPTRAGCWSRPPGTTAGPIGPAQRCRPAGTKHHRRPGPAVTWATAAYTTVGPAPSPA